MNQTLDAVIAPVNEAAGVLEKLKGRNRGGARALAYATRQRADLCRAIGGRAWTCAAESALLASLQRLASRSRRTMRSARILRRGVLLDQLVDDDPLCRDCDGVCCRSFASVSLSWEEGERLRALGAQRLEFTLTGAWLLIEGGCEFQVGARCSIYPHRPAICRRFVCLPDEDPLPIAQASEQPFAMLSMPLA